MYSVSINIDFEGNMFFSTYDVAMYLDDTVLAVLPHGEDFSDSFNVKEGEYKISFYKQEKREIDKEVGGIIDLSVVGNTEITCRINCYSNEVDVNDLVIKTINNEPITDATDIISEKQKTEEPIGDHYDESLEGHGRGSRANEPNYVGVIGYVTVYGDQARDIENSGDIENKDLWEVATYEPDKQFWNETGKLLHKTEVVVREQMLYHRSYGNYSGYLLVEKKDDGTKHYIDVKNFETKPYWTYQDKMETAASIGIFLAEFKQVSNYYPVYENGMKANVKDGTIVLVIGKAGAFSKNIGTTIKGVRYIKKNKKSKGTFYFNPADLTIIY